VAGRPNPQKMLDFLGEKASARTRGLFAAACWGRTTLARANPLCRDALAVAERHAEGAADRAQWEAALGAAIQGVQWSCVVSREAL
jgi:hypothetical protein